MKMPERNHETKIPYIIDTEDGPINKVIDLESMSDDELSEQLFTVPEAINEVVYRDMVKYVKNTKE